MARPARINSICTPQWVSQPLGVLPKASSYSASTCALAAAVSRRLWRINITE